MHIRGLRTLVLVISLFSIASIASGRADISSVDMTLKVARQKLSLGDKEGASLLYQRALQMDNTNQEASRALAGIVIEAQAAAPYSEETDILAILQERATEPPFPATYFSLAFLNNGALSAQDEHMSRAVLLALRKLQINNHTAAIKIAASLQSKYPQHPVPYNLLGLAWQSKGDPGKAHEFFEQALALQENFHVARLNLAELELYVGKFNAAHQAVDTVLKNDAGNRRAFLVKAQLYTLEGQKALAKAWYTKASAEL